MSQTLRKHRTHPNGWTLNLSMAFDGQDVAGWVPVGLWRLELAAGYAIDAEFGSVDGFPCWKYRTSTPDGKTLGTYPSAASAALWIERDIRAKNHAG